MSEIEPNPHLPSGYESAEQLEQRVAIGPELLPWLKKPTDLSVSEVQLQSGEVFLLASAVGTHPRLVEAANGMTDKQRQITDNMLYSRLPELLQRGYSPSIETMPNPVTDFPIFVMRNKGGQRVYFSRTNLTIDKETGEQREVLVRLGVCDKNKQAAVLAVLSGSSGRQMQRKLSK